MKKKSSIVLLLIVLFTLKVNFANSQSPYIYGMVFNGTDTSFLGRLNYQTGQFDSIMPLVNINVVNTAAACFDVKNNRYIFCGSWGGHSGNYHMINLNNYTVESFSSRDAVSIEYNPYNNTLIFQESSDFCTIDLVSKTVNCVSSPLFNYGSGKKRVFNSIDTSYIYFNSRPDSSKSINSILTIDANDGKLICMEDSLQSYLGDDFVIDNSSGNLFCHQNEEVFRVDQCSGILTKLLSIPGYFATLNQQLAVYDQTRKKYIIPFVNSNYKAKIAVIDMINLKIDTIYMQPNDGMNFQQIGNYPVVNIQEINRTFILQIYPNPNNGKFTIKSNNEISYIEVYNLTGKLLYSVYNLHRQTSVDIDLSDLLKGIYFARIHDGKQVITEKIIIQ